MKTIFLVFFSFLILVSPNCAQTQLLKIGNATGFGDYLYGPFSADITVDKVLINGDEYFKRKLGWNDPLGDYTVSYERIIGDSAYYVLSTSGTDSLAFNFNWPVGKVFLSHTVGNTVYEKKIGNISIGSILIPQDTLFSIIFYSIDLATGDTTYGYGVYFGTIHSKKLGKTDEGIFINLQGAKIDGVRYGDIIPYPEEIYFTVDSIYIPTFSDSGSTEIINTSELPVRIDSIISVGSFYGYWGNFSKTGFEYPFYLVQSIPGFMGDTLGIIIPPHDSINVSFSNVDLCPFCDYSVQEFFKDTLRFVFTFLDGNIYSFDKSIPIIGEGHPSDIVDNEVMPNEFMLHHNYPNPFNPSTKISWRSPVGSWQTLKIFDVLGNEVATLVNEEKPAGNYEVNFDASKLSSGVYYYQLRAIDPSTGSGQGFVETKKMILLK